MTGLFSEVRRKGTISSSVFYTLLSKESEKVAVLLRVLHFTVVDSTPRFRLTGFSMGFFVVLVSLDAR